MIEKMNRLVIAAYRLPFNFAKGKNGIIAIQNSGGLVSAILSLSEKFQNSGVNENHQKILWAGTADNVMLQNPTVPITNEQFDICPISLPSTLNELYYGGFCNDLIWPLFHYFPTYSIFNYDYFKAFEEANTLFCDQLVKNIHPGDFIWVHDYQLMLLPELLRKRIPDVTIGFFLHIPFPSFEIFRLLPRNWREAIVKGMLGADMIGFHTNDYTQHFIKSVKRTTGFECRQNIIYTPNKIVKADAFPIGIDYEKFNSACLSKKVFTEKDKIRKHLMSQMLIFSVDRLDYSKGLLLKLDGYECFLEKYPKWHGNVVFNMVIVPSRDNINRYIQMRKEIEYTVGRINGNYSTLSWRPIVYQYKSLSFYELVALYDLSDVGLITPLRDGMNLVAKEYVACQIENKGVLILSEMAGAAAELNEALIINPADRYEISDAIFTALEMPPEEKKIRLERMQHRISTYNVFTWAYDFFNQTFEIKEQQKKMNAKFITADIVSQILSDYKKANHRILFLDYDGTLVPFSKYPDMATLDTEVYATIEQLTLDPKNKVVIISGRNKEFLDQQFRNLNLALVAEHGNFIKDQDQKWQATVIPDLKWKNIVFPILTEYVSRCNGTYIEEKTGSLVWHYRNADLDFAQLRLHELRDDLSEIIRHKTDFEILEGNKVLEVKCGNYSKGQAALALMHDMNYDFILGVGDDTTDESLFKVLPNNSISIRIGLSPSFANYNVSNNQSFLKILKSLL